MKYLNIIDIIEAELEAFAILTAYYSSSEYNDYLEILIFLLEYGVCFYNSSKMTCFSLFVRPKLSLSLVVSLIDLNMFK